LLLNEQNFFGYQRIPEFNLEHIVMKCQLFEVAESEIVKILKV